MHLLRFDLRGAKRPITVYLDSGWPHDNYEFRRNLRNTLARHGRRQGHDLHYFAFPQAVHDERHWALRAHLPLQVFFGERAGADPGAAGAH